MLLRSSWTPGPARNEGELLVTVTEFTADHLWDMPRIYQAGRRLARLWPTLDGAVGHWLWADPVRRRSGSVALWKSDQAMRDFVRLPVHRQIVRTYRSRGSVRSIAWTINSPELAETWRRAMESLRAEPGRVS
jgi:hypothetical protein